MPGKRYKEAVKDLPKEKISLGEAVKLIKERAKAAFDETIEVHVSLGVDPKASDQAVRGSVDLPHGSPSKVKVAVFCEDPKKQEAAKQAGADVVGGEELIEKVQTDKDLDADTAVATPAMMSKMAKIAKVLGPRGLMPNPKSGTISENPAEAISSLKGGKITYKMDDTGNVHAAIAKASWDENKIQENARALLEAVRQARPAAAKGEFIRSVSLSSTMGPGIEVIG